MKTKSAAAILVVVVFAFAFGCSRTQPGNSTAKTQPGEEPVTQKLPPLPPGVTELKFSEFFVSPVGPLGLELTAKLRELDGKRVRILGYMVQQENARPASFLLSSYPAQIHHHDNALADSLPPALVHVTVPTDRDKPVPFSPRLLLLTGTLSVGNKAEPDGRISVVRLLADAPQPAAYRNGVQLSSLANKSTHH